MGEKGEVVWNRVYIRKDPGRFHEPDPQGCASSGRERISALHLPHKNQFIPTKLEVQKKDVKEPAPDATHGQK